MQSLRSWNYLFWLDHSLICIYALGNGIRVLISSLENGTANHRGIAHKPFFKASDRTTHKWIHTETWLRLDARRQGTIKIHCTHSLQTDWSTMVPFVYQSARPKLGWCWIESAIQPHHSRARQHLRISYATSVFSLIHAFQGLLFCGGRVYRITHLTLLFRKLVGGATPTHAWWCHNTAQGFQEQSLLV